MPSKDIEEPRDDGTHFSEKASFILSQFLALEWNKMPFPRNLG